MNNTITINNKEYNRDELSVEANQLIEQISLVQAELNKQSILLGTMELGSTVLIDQLSQKIEAEVSSKPEGDLISKSLSLDTDVEGA